MEFEVVCVDRGVFPGSRGSKIIRLGILAGDKVEVIEKSTLLYRMSKGDRYFVQRAGHKVYLHQAVSPQGNTFVETEADDTLLDNLASLPGCTKDDKITYGTGKSDPNDVDGGSDGGPDSDGPDSDVDSGDP